MELKFLLSDFLHIPGDFIVRKAKEKSKRAREGRAELSRTSSVRPSDGSKQFIETARWKVFGDDSFMDGYDQRPSWILGSRICLDVFTTFGLFGFNYFFWTHGMVSLRRYEMSLCQGQENGSFPRNIVELYLKNVLIIEHLSHYHQ